MNWLPRVTNVGCCLAVHDGEYEGVGILIEWFGFAIEIAAGRHNRQYR